MNSLDWAVLIGYFGVMVAIGVWSHKRVDNVSDFFTAGGKMPWWLSGISHHMSGYSAVMFTGYAGIAYQYGITSYVTWSFPIAIGIAIGAKLFAPRLNRLRSRLHVASPLEYLKNRYNLPTQQALAWSGRAAEDRGRGRQVGGHRHPAVRLHRGLPHPGHPDHRRDHRRLLHGRRAVGGRAHRTRPVHHPARGRYRDAGRRRWTSSAASARCWTVWDEPAATATPSRPRARTPLIFLLAYLFIKTFEYNGGMWNQAQRYMATDNAQRGHPLGPAVGHPVVRLAAGAVLPDVGRRRCWSGEEAGRAPTRTP